MQHRFQRLVGALSEGVLERETALSLGLLALLAGESLFLLGPPGVAKSLVARRLKAALQNARAFEYLMGRFSTPEEIFGPLSIAGLRDRDVFERKTTGYLPEADIAFLDEIWRSSPPIQNSLLTILNEKVFRNGGLELKVALKLLVAASNGLPEGEENAEAFWDRFLLRLEVGPVESAQSFRNLVTGHSTLEVGTVAPEDVITNNDWLDFQEKIDQVSLPETVLDALEALRESLEQGPYVSDRRWKRAAKILKACAVVHGRKEVDSLDLGLLEHVLWHKPSERPEVVRVLLETLSDFGWPSDVSLDELADGVETQRENLRRLMLKERKMTRPKPVLQDGEYFALVGYQGPLSARVWAQDYALLKTEEDLEGELFFFTPYGPFQHSEKHLLRGTGGSAEIEVDGRLYLLENQAEEITVWDKVLPDGQALRAWENHAEALAKKVLDARQALEDLSAQKSLEAKKHIFCSGESPNWSAACRQGLERDVLIAGDLLVDLETLIETRNPGDSRR
jgi:MoxR-like ATPase